MKKTIFLSGTTVLALAGIFLSAGCSQKPSQSSAPPAPAVTVTTISQKDIVEWEEFTGRTEAMESVEVRPRVSGYIREVRFQSGQLVKKGDVLFVIDPRWHESDYNRLQAEAGRARAQLDNAKREADRTSNLLKDHAISAEESEARISRYEEAKAALDAAEAARDYAKLDLEFTQVRAPIDGRVSRALITQGNYVTGGSGAGTVLTTLVSVDPVYVYADVDEDSLLRFNALVAAGRIETNADGRTPVQLQLADEQGFPHQGCIESFDNHLDENTGSILLRAVFPNADGRIVPGLFARIRLPMSEKHPAVLVTESAVGTDQARKYVLTLTSTNTVAYQPVELGPEFEGKRVVRSGLTNGDKVVVNGLQRVRPGMAVTPQDQDGAETGRMAYGK
ncbi:MAG TPA: efflux RND transporter periplasmic adaptor subunit [Verrucomicrobiae bacterium]|jgi:multidrug efflux system membrane fusion protein|nr:efflux RND transporter periplasmic adaptor subunit [Verrucomicrobiae bacterium]